MLFPPGRTAVGAHVTLFHAVPGGLADDVDAALAEAAKREPFVVRFDSVMSLGRGAAYHFESSALSSLHRALQRRWDGVLTRQDEQPLRAHVTVQNKVGGDEARATLARLRATFVPFDATATGLRSWRYDGGPWVAIAEYPFAID